MSAGHQERLDAATRIAENAAQSALVLFNDNPSLNIEVKGAQDWVSNADKSVETEIRNALAAEFPNDGIIGEEHGQVTGSSGYTWVIDPIDGTSNFVNAMPGWCVVIACVSDTATQLGVIVDPIAGETFSVSKGHGAYCNEKPMQVSKAADITQGSVAIGHSSRVNADDTIAAIKKLMDAGGMFYRNGSGALMLAYVASGRLIGYVEPHMFAWDCMAGLLMIEEAGGKVAPYDHQTMLQSGYSVISSSTTLFDAIETLSR